MRGSDLEGEIQQLEEQVGSFDFDEAQKTLRGIAESLEIAFA